MNKTDAAIAAVAIPDPGPALDVERFNVEAVLSRLERVHDLAEVDEYRQRAQALATYLANRLDPGPANRIANMAAVRIGELLGPAERGKPSHGRLNSAAGELNRQARSEFRLMASYRTVVEANAHLSRAQVLQAIECRRDEERRIELLPPDLAERVRSETDPMTLAEAEQVVADREARLAALVDRIRSGLRTFARMVGFPPSEEVSARLTPIEQAAIAAVVNALAKEDVDGLME